jgi:hypothetical protein
VKRRLARWMRRTADRIDRAGAPKASSMTFTFENRRGIVVHGLDDGPARGCRLWYLNDAEYEKAWTEAVDPPELRVHWASATASRWKGVARP